MARVVQLELGPTMHSESAHSRSMSVISSKPLDNLAVVRDGPLLASNLDRTSMCVGPRFFDILCGAYFEEMTCPRLLVQFWL